MMTVLFCAGLLVVQGKEVDRLLFSSQTHLEAPEDGELRRFDDESWSSKPKVLEEEETTPKPKVADEEETTLDKPKDVKETTPKPKDEEETDELKPNDDDEV